MSYPDDLVLRDREAPEADAAEQARPVHEDNPAEAFVPGDFAPGDGVDEADAVEQAREVQLSDDDYR
ncbi:MULTISPECIES: hypothetical protein [Catenuloplanes]|uniref:Uncharacterized protein n=1 Tax=Catenuloplanes niger TaxID=587534 RepID=A0AAE3ZRL4_9ACTN|nr:hypothetical protein [Catenuloplanes niger]MDR7323702.1 hypothetical protein [Catenuloplanes niger]